MSNSSHSNVKICLDTRFAVKNSGASCLSLALIFKLSNQKMTTLQCSRPA